MEAVYEQLTVVLDTSDGCLSARFACVLQQSAASLLNQPEKEVNSKGLLYVHQREYAAVAPDDS